MMLTRARMCFLPLLAALALQAQAQDREWKRLSEFMEITRMDKFLSAPPEQRDKVKLFGSVRPSNKAIKASDVVYTVVHAKGRERITVDATGNFDLAPFAKYLAEDPMILISLPEGEKASYGFAVEPVVPAGPSMAYVDLTGGVPQFNALIKAKAGAFSFMFPKFNAVVLRFAKPAQQTVQILAKEGNRTLTADAKGAITIPLDDKLFAENPKVLVSETFKSVDFEKI